MQESFRRYTQLVEKADRAFAEISNSHPACVTCTVGCADCCHAVFGLFLVEAAYLSHSFVRLPQEVQRRVLSRTDAFDARLDSIQKRLSPLEDNPRAGNLALARERIRCPLLDDDDRCVLYEHRPITCRLYGIPIAIQGRMHVCNRAAFDPEGSHPTFDLDLTYRGLYLITRELLAAAGEEDAEKASLLVSVSRAVRTPAEKLVRERLC